MLCEVVPPQSLGGYTITGTNECVSDVSEKDIQLISVDLNRLT